MLDVAIVGAGPAGLDAAYRLRDRKIAVFEREREVGGRTRTAIVAGEPINRGALYVYYGTETEAICNELGIGVLPVEPSTYSLHYRGTTVTEVDAGDLVRDLPIPDAAKSDFLDLLVSLRNLYGEHAAHGLLESSQSLSRQSFADFLGTREPEVAEILRTACICASTTYPEDLSTQYALRYVASYFVKDHDHRGYIPGGMQTMSLALQQRLGDAVRLNSTVSAVEKLPTGFALWVTTASGTERVEAREVVMAVPGPLVATLAPWLPEWKLRAIEDVPTAESIVMAVVLETDGSSPWDQVYFIPTVGTAFQGMIQGRVGPAFRPHPTGKTTIYAYAHRDAVREALNEPDEAVEARWIEDFYRVFPAARGKVAGTYLQKWPECFAYIRADRAEPLALVQRPVDGMHFAGDYASASAGSHGAFGSGDRVARDVAAGVRV